MNWRELPLTLVLLIPFVNLAGALPQRGDDPARTSIAADDNRVTTDSGTRILEMSERRRNNTAFRVGGV